MYETYDTSYYIKKIVNGGIFHECGPSSFY
jgi:hypothetical protein